MRTGGRGTPAGSSRTSSANCGRPCWSGSGERFGQRWEAKPGFGRGRLGERPRPRPGGPRLTAWRQAATGCSRENGASVGRVVLHSIRPTEARLADDTARAPCPSLLARWPAAHLPASLLRGRDRPGPVLGSFSGPPIRRGAASPARPPAARAARPSQPGGRTTAGPEHGVGLQMAAALGGAGVAPADTPPPGRPQQFADWGVGASDRHLPASCRAGSICPSTATSPSCFRA